MEWKENTVKVAGGELVSPFSLRIIKEVSQKTSFSETSSLFDKWVGLPGTIGGAVAGNAGCFGFEAKDAVLEVTIFDMETGEYRTLGNTELDFSYRHSILKDMPNWFLIDAVFRTDLVSDDTTQELSVLGNNLEDSPVDHFSETP